MKREKSIAILVIAIALLASVATIAGIVTDEGPGEFTHESIRGEFVQIYGQGLYRHMSADVAPQGIAQDYITLFLAVPLLILSLLLARRGSLRGRYLLAGVLAYFFVTYLFYLVMAMYNTLFVIYVVLLGCSFFALAFTLAAFDIDGLPDRFAETAPVRPAGGFLLINAFAIGLLWLHIVVPPLFDGTMIPLETEHYTTLIVQGLDLAILLPLAIISGIWFIRREPAGYLIAPVYLIFLSILMTALLAKIVTMGLLGQRIIPAVFFIPVFAAFSIYFSARLLQSCQAVETTS